MEYALKVSNKGQVTLPNKRRDALEVKDLTDVDVKGKKGIIKKTESKMNELGGCFKQYASKKNEIRKSYRKYYREGHT